MSTALCELLATDQHIWFHFNHKHSFIKQRKNLSNKNSTSAYFSSQLSTSFYTPRVYLLIKAEESKLTSIILSKKTLTRSAHVIKHFRSQQLIKHTARFSGCTPRLQIPNQPIAITLHTSSHYLSSVFTKPFNNISR